MDDGVFLHDEYLIRRKLLALVHGVFEVFDPSGTPILFSRQRAFKLKEDIRIYSDPGMSEERLLIKARHVVDFSAAYDVVDPVEGKKVGALRRKGFRSFLRDSWEFLDDDDQPVVKVEEDHMALALCRRFLSNLIPQTFHASANGTQLVTYKQLFNPFIQKLRVRISPEAREVLDPRVILAGGILLVAIEGRQR